MANDSKPQTELEMLCTQEARVLLLGDGMGVCVGGRYDAWLMRRSPDGHHWVTERKLEVVDPRGEWTELLPTS